MVLDRNDDVAPTIEGGGDLGVRETGVLCTDIVISASDLREALRIGLPVPDQNALEDDGGPEITIEDPEDDQPLQATDHAVSNLDSYSFAELTKEDVLAILMQCDEFRSIALLPTDDMDNLAELLVKKQQVFAPGASLSRNNGELKSGLIFCNNVSLVKDGREESRKEEKAGYFFGYSALLKSENSNVRSMASMNLASDSQQLRALAIDENDIASLSPQAQFIIYRNTFLKSVGVLRDTDKDAMEISPDHVQPHKPQNLSKILSIVRDLGLELTDEISFPLEAKVSNAPEFIQFIENNLALIMAGSSVDVEVEETPNTRKIATINIADQRSFRYIAGFVAYVALAFTGGETPIKLKAIKDGAKVKYLNIDKLNSVAISDEDALKAKAFFQELYSAVVYPMIKDKKDWMDRIK